jgi:serine/threonine protein kinase
VIGETISHYRIVQKLGGGGMGEVYEAEDIRLGRRVALKFLPDSMSGNPVALERFQLEARTTSSLNHPGICTIFDIASHNGMPIIVMELLQGETLKARLTRGPLSPDEVIDYGIQLASALDAAHQRGIIHRDIKPGNIFITKLGHTKVLDFGLAKLKYEPKAPELHAAGDGHHAMAEAMTELTAIPGTTLYMSPEQVGGQALDERTDLFSLGVVLYEAATGHKPFQARSAVLTMTAIQHQRPVSPLSYEPDLPPEMEQLLGGLLEKDRRLRYQSARELAEDLQRLKRQVEIRRLHDTDFQLVMQRGKTFRKLSTRQLYILLAAAGVITMILLAVTIWWAKHTSTNVVTANNTILVLPFNNIAHDPDIDYLRLALADELVKILAYTRSLEIRPVPTAPKYMSGEFDPQQAGRDYKAAVVLTGHFAAQGGRLTITMEAIDVRHNRLMWQGSFTVPQQNLISLQEDLSFNVKSGLLPALGSQAAMLASATQPRNADAYDLYLRGAALPHDPEPNSTAVVMLEHSVQLDSKFAPAWDALGLRYYYDASYAGGGVEAFDKAANAYETALKLDPNLISSVAHLARIHAERGQIVDAYREARDLVTRRPENAQAHFTMAYVLRYAGMLYDSIRECDAALALDPSNYDFRSCSFSFFELGRTTRALEFVHLDSGSEWAASVLPAILLREGRMDEARVAANKISPGGTWFAPIFQACVKPASVMDMKRIADQYAPQLLGLRDAELRYYHGAILSYCGQTDLAAKLIGSAISARYCSTVALNTDPLLERLRATAAFPALVKAANQCQEDFLKATK